MVVMRGERRAQLQNASVSAFGKIGGLGCAALCCHHLRSIALGEAGLSRGEWQQNAWWQTKRMGVRGT